MALLIQHFWLGKHFKNEKFESFFLNETGPGFKCKEKRNECDFQWAWQEHRQVSSLEAIYKARRMRLCYRLDLGFTKRTKQREGKKYLRCCDRKTQPSANRCTESKKTQPRPQTLSLLCFKKASKQTFLVKRYLWKKVLEGCWWWSDTELL